MIYIYTLSDGKNTRVSKSSFGSPMNYLSSSNQLISLSSRFPSISGNGRHVLYSSDAEDSWGLIFDGSNQLPSDDNGLRDIYHFDRKTSAMQTKQIGDIQFLYPKADLNYSFSPQTSIPVIVDFDVSPNVSGLVFARVFVNGIALPGVMSQHGVPNPFSPDFSNFLSHRFDQSIPSSYTITGINTIQVAMFDSNNSNEQVAISDLITVDVSPYVEYSPTIDLQEIPSDFDKITDTSSLIISARTSDLDASLDNVEFFINGEPTGGKIFRSSGSRQSDVIYQLYHEPNVTGIFSVHALSQDNSGNYVASSADHFTVTDGTIPASVDFTDDSLKNIELVPDIDFIVKLTESNGSIESITLLKEIAPGFNAVGVNILGSGKSAVATANLDANGTIQEIIMDSGGIGYEKRILKTEDCAFKKNPEDRHPC